MRLMEAADLFSVGLLVLSKENNQQIPSVLQCAEPEANGGYMCAITN